MAAIVVTTFTLWQAHDDGHVMKCEVLMEKHDRTIAICVIFAVV